MIASAVWSLLGGSFVELLLLDAAADMDADEHAALESSIRRGLDDADRGELHSVDEVVARLRRILMRILLTSEAATLLEVCDRGELVQRVWRRRLRPASVLRLSRPRDPNS